MHSDAKRLRREGKFDLAIARFREAIALAESHGVGATTCYVEIARTIWHAGDRNRALAMAETYLPDLEAMKLVISLYRERAKECVKSGGVDEALMCFASIDATSRLHSNTHGMFSQTDRKTVAMLRRQRKS